MSPTEDLDWSGDMGVVKGRPEDEGRGQSMLREEEEEEGSVRVVDMVESDRGPISRLVSAEERLP